MLAITTATHNLLPLCIWWSVEDSNLGTFRGAFTARWLWPLALTLHETASTAIKLGGYRGFEPRPQGFGIPHAAITKP